jgi:prepilin-type N-terminal cleavage/methylation domain-containing protein
MRRAFTLIEIIFVLVVLGIVASLGSEIIAKVYESYILSRTISGTSYKLDVAASQIAKRLSYRVNGTEIARDVTNPDPATNIIPMVNNSGEVYQHIEWIGRAYEARRGKWDGSKLMPGWSGLADLNRSTITTLYTPGSDLQIAQDIISPLYNIDIATEDKCAIIFYDTGQSDPLEAYGWNSQPPISAHKVKKSATNAFAFSDTTTKKYASDIYDLSCSAYALRWTSDKKLRLYYDYRPWLGEKYSDGKNVVLVENVTAFMTRKRDIDGAIQFRLCVKEKRLNAAEVEFCTKKVVF